MKTFNTFVQELNESYHSLITVGKEKITIFVNPNSSEIRESMSQFGRA